VTLSVHPVDTDDFIRALRKRSPDHGGPLGCAHWRLVRDAIEGTGGFLAGLRDLRVYDYGPDGSRYGSSAPLAKDGSTYLAQFPRESAEDFSARVRATTYDNHVAPVARTYTGQLWTSTPQRETTIDAVRAFWADPDAGLGAVDAWMRDGSDRALRCGWAACLIDRPEGERPATAPGTVGRWLEPDELLDWRLDDRGAFEWVRLCSRVASSDPITGVESEREIITVWTRTYWRRFDLAKSGERWTIEADSGAVDHTLGRVPLAVLRWVPTSDRDDLYAPSVLSGSVSASVELFNVRSEQRAIERDCVFPVLCVQTSDPDRFQGSKVSTHSGLAVEPGMGFPAFVSPDAAVTVHYAGRVEELTTRVYEAAYLDRPSASAVAPESGVARAYRFRQMSGLLVTAAGEHEAFEREVVSILAAWDGADAAAWQNATTISYPRRFDPQDAETQADAGMAVLKESDRLVPELDAQARAQIAAALFPRLSPDAAARLRTELALRAAFEREQFTARFDIAKLSQAAAPSSVELNSFSTPFMTANEVRAQIGVGVSDDPLANTIPALEELRAKLAAQALEAAAQQTAGIDAATNAAVNALPEATPGDVVIGGVATEGTGTTAGAGA